MHFIQTLLRFIKHRAALLLLSLYTRWTKLSQQPRIWREREPRFEFDDTVTPARGEVYAIVVKYAGHGESANLCVLLDALRRANVNAVLVCNGTVAPDELAQLRPHVHRVMGRRNVGRDFGAYRAATLRLQAQGLAPERMLYFNDSLLYVEGTELDRLVAEFVFSEFDVVGLGENQYEHHIGSFALSMAGHVFNHRRLREFWHRYKPYDLRKHAIHAGEIALTKTIKRAGFSIDVLFDVPRLAGRLRGMTLAELIAATRWLPFGFRRHALLNLVRESFAARQLLLAGADAMDDDVQEPIDTAPSATPTLTQLQSLRAAQGRPALLPRRGGTPRPQSAPTDGIADAADHLARQVLIDQIIEQVTTGSQMHFGFGLFYRLLGCPVIKRDLFARGIYREHDCAEILGNIPAPTRHRLLRDLINRGRFDMEVGRWRSLLYRNGML